MDQVPHFTSANELTELAWRFIVQACTQRRHPFHTPTLSTLSERGPESRCVILRYADPNAWELRANADVRSPKAQELQSDPRCTWLFYSFPDHLQVRCYGRTQIHHLDDVAAEAWQKSQLLSRRCYLAPMSPSTVLDQPNSNLLPELTDREPTEEEAQAGFANFSVMRCQVEQMDILSLRFDGNVRIQVTPNSNPIWIAP